MEVLDAVHRVVVQHLPDGLWEVELGDVLAFDTTA
jgi:hypothetical protein